MNDHLMSKIERGGTSVPVGDGHAPSGGAGPVERTYMVRPVLPCATCAHATVCAIRPKLEAAAGNFRPPMSPDPAVTIAVKATVTCTFYSAGGLAEPRGTMGSKPEVPAFRRAVSEDTRIATSAQRGAAASKAARAAGTARSRVGSLSTIASVPPQRPPERPLAPGRHVRTPEERKRTSDAMKAKWAQRRAAKAAAG